MFINADAHMQLQTIKGTKVRAKSDILLALYFFLSLSVSFSNLYVTLISMKSSIMLIVNVNINVFFLNLGKMKLPFSGTCHTFIHLPFYPACRYKYTHQKSKLSIHTFINHFISSFIWLRGKDNRWSLEQWRQYSLHSPLI